MFLTDKLKATADARFVYEDGEMSFVDLNTKGSFREVKMLLHLIDML